MPTSNSFIHSGDLYSTSSETTIQRRSQPCLGQRRRISEMKNLEGWVPRRDCSSKGRSFHADSLPTRRAAERRTRSNRAKGEPRQQTAAVNTAGYKCADEGESRLVGERSGNHPKLA